MSKRFTAGQAIEVRRDYSIAWVPATYVAPAHEIGRSVHRVKLATPNAPKPDPLAWYDRDASFNRSGKVNGRGVCRRHRSRLDSHIALCGFILLIEESGSEDDEGRPCLRCQRITADLDHTLDLVTCAVSAGIDGALGEVSRQVGQMGTTLTEARGAGHLAAGPFVTALRERLYPAPKAENKPARSPQNKPARTRRVKRQAVTTTLLFGRIKPARKPAKKPARIAENKPARSRDSKP